ncbi:hypothetical protein QUA13_18860, partial [Microcoleus sp. S28C3]
SCTLLSIARSKPRPRKVRSIYSASPIYLVQSIPAKLDVLIQILHGKVQAIGLGGSFGLEGHKLILNGGNLGRDLSVRDISCPLLDRPDFVNEVQVVVAQLRLQLATQRVGKASDITVEHTEYGGFVGNFFLNIGIVLVYRYHHESKQQAVEQAYNIHDKGHLLVVTFVLTKSPAHDGSNEVYACPAKGNETNDEQDGHQPSRQVVHPQEHIILRSSLPADLLYTTYQAIQLFVQQVDVATFLGRCASPIGLKLFLYQILVRSQTEGNLQSKKRGNRNERHLTSKSEEVRVIVAEHPDANAGRVVLIICTKNQKLGESGSHVPLLTKIRAKSQKKTWYSSQAATERVQKLRVEYWDKIKDIKPENERVFG